MISKVMQVFYGEDCLPYKDSDRTIHFPIVGTAISGSSNVNEIRFYVNRIGGATNTTWVAISKLPNGKTSTEILSTVVEDTELGEYYIVFNLTAYYTQFKGDLYISLQGFQNGVTFTLVNDVYQLSGTPTVQATGSIKIPINYAPVFHNYQLPVDQLTQILALFSSYNQITNSIVVLINTSVDVSGYEEGQVFFVKSDGAFYRKNSMGTLTLEAYIKANVVVADNKYKLNDADVLYIDDYGNTVISCATGEKVIYSGSEIANKEYTDANFANEIGVNAYTSATDLELEFVLYSKDDDQISSAILSIPLATTTDAGLLAPSDKSKLNNVPIHTISSLGSKIDKASIVDNLTTADATKVLSAWQGRTLENKKVDKTTTIMGIDLADNITRSEVITAIGEATQSLSGVMSATDKSRLDALHALLNEGSANDVVDSINEVLAIFNNYPEGVDIVTALAGKVDKVAGMDLSHNDYSDTEKGKVTTAYNHSQATGNPHAIKYSELNDKPTTLSALGVTDVYTKEYIDSLKDMNGWESELITETPLTNGQSVTLATLQSFDVIKLFARNTSTNEIDTDSFETSLGLVSGYEYRLFDNADIKFVIGATNCTFTTTAGYELSIIGQKYTELKASDVSFDDTGTNYLVSKTDVESAVKELDTQVKGANDYINIEINKFDSVVNYKIEPVNKVENVFVYYTDGSLQTDVTSDSFVKIPILPNREIKLSNVYINGNRGVVGFTESGLLTTFFNGTTSTEVTFNSGNSTLLSFSVRKDYIPVISYIDGIDGFGEKTLEQSSETDEVGNYNEQLINVGYPDISGYINFYGTFVPHASYKCTDFIEVRGGEEITLNNILSADGMSCHLYDKDQNHIMGITYQTSPTVISTVDIETTLNTKYIRYTLSSLQRVTTNLKYKNKNKKNHVQDNIINNLLNKAKANTLVPFAQATNKPILTIIDDDTSTPTAVERFYNKLTSLGIVGTYACLTRQFTMHPTLKDLLKSYERLGFQTVIHGYEQGDFYKNDSNRDISLCIDDLVHGMEDLNEANFLDYKQWVTPFGVSDLEMQNLAKKLGLECLVNIGSSQINGTNGEFGRYRIQRYGLNEGFSIPTVQGLIDKTVEQNGWLIFGTHSGTWTTTFDDFDTIINYAKSQGMEIMTLGEALRRRKPIYNFYEMF